MKTILIFIIISLFNTEVIFSQQFQGIAVYKSQQSVDFKMDSTKVNNEMMKKMQEELRKQFQKDYTLKFDGKESLYTENAKLEAPSTQSSNIKITINTGNDIVYRNIANQSFVNQKELMGKLFLIKDSLQVQDWKLEKETKKIGEYTCYKATYTKEVKVQTFNSENDGIVETIKNVTTVAWYTPEIPVSIGPAGYWGLPGLILEIQENNQTLLCTGITINPTEKFHIEIPSKGKVISQDEFTKIQKEKNEEWIERNSGKTSGGYKIISVKTSGQ